MIFMRTRNFSSLAWTLKIMESPTSTTLEGSQLW